MALTFPPPLSCESKDTTGAMERDRSSSHQGKRRKRHHNFAPKSLQDKVKEYEGTKSMALETNDQDSCKRRRRTAGIYGRHNPLNRKRQFRTPKGGSTTRTNPSRRSRFSRPSVRKNIDVPSSQATHVVCTISENMARETCVASLDAGSPTTLQVTKQGNSQTYAETVAYLEMLQPDEILLNEGRQTSQLARKVLELYDATNKDDEEPLDDVDQVEENRFGSLQTHTVVKFLPRSLFDQTKGGEFLKRVSRHETYDATILEEYILLSASYALLHYVQHCLGSTFAKNSICLSINAGGNDRLSIDRSTMTQLELLVNSKSGKARNSLVDTIDHTKTSVGSRLLRTNLMSPPNDVDGINSRLDLVDVFLQNEDFFYDVMDHLEAFPDVDKMLANVSLVPKFVGRQSTSNLRNQRIASKGISALVCIKSTLQALPLLVSVIKTMLQNLTGNNLSELEQPFDDTTIATNRASLSLGLGHGETVPLVQHHLLRAIAFAFSQPDLAAVLEIVSDVLSESSTYSRNACAMRHQECFALKCDETELMAVYRESFLQNTDEIYRKADEYAELYTLTVKVKYTNARGYFLTIPTEYAAELPDVFIQPTRSGRNIYCTTMEVASLSEKVNENVYDLLLMTHDRIESVLNVVREKYDALATVGDAIALLDLCHSFADHVASNEYVRAFS